MRSENNTFTGFSNMRQKAEEQLNEIGNHDDSSYAVKDANGQSEADYLKLLHELQVHKIELEMQNEELKLAREKSEIATEKYSMLYDFAPTGYFTLNSDCRIIELNLHGAELLGKDRSELIGRNFNSFVTYDTLTAFNEFFQSIFSTNSKQVCEVKLSIKDNPYISVHIEGVASCYDDNCLLTVVDISGKLAEEQIRNQLNGKEILLHEVHHRIKNNMNTISGLLQLQSDLECNTEVKKTLSDVASRVKVMQVLYDKLYLSVKTCEMSLNDYFPDLIMEILSIFPQRESVTVNTRIEDIVLRAQTLSILGIIVNELITNSMKYAFTGRESFEITITASQIVNSVIMIYEDNGVGIPENISFENSTGFGMKLVGMLVDQIDGKINIEREKGTRIILEFNI